MGDKEVFLEKIRFLRSEAQRTLITQGIVIDDILKRELSEPGFDSRKGVNIICRPPSDIVELIVSIQDYLRQWERGQYYYPEQDLHLTFLEICHSKDSDQAAFLANTIREKMKELTADLTSPTVDSPLLAFDTRGAALNLLPIDESLQVSRRILREKIQQLGVEVDARYIPASAHISLLRYVQPLRTAPEEWVDVLLNVPGGQSRSWSFSELWLTWGSNWYGMRSRINEAGPYLLAS